MKKNRVTPEQQYNYQKDEVESSLKIFVKEVKDNKFDQEDVRQIQDQVEELMSCADKVIEELKEEKSDLHDVVENTENDLHSRSEIIASTIYDREKMRIVERLFNLPLDYLLKIEKGVCEENVLYGKKYGHLTQKVI